MRSEALVAVALVLALSAVSSAQVGSAFDFRIERLVATPTPVGPVIVLSDDASWQLVIPEATSVFVDVQAGPNAPFFLTTDCRASLVVLPTSRDAVICNPSPDGPRHVQVDPAAGVAVDIRIRFRGHVVDLPGAPSDFTLVESPARAGCVVPGVCLP